MLLLTRVPLLSMLLQVAGSRIKEEFLTTATAGFLIMQSNWLAMESMLPRAQNFGHVFHFTFILYFSFCIKKSIYFRLIRNSWGTDWGENGYIRLLRRDDDDTKCGLDTKAQEGGACKDEPSQVTVCGCNGILYPLGVTISPTGAPTTKRDPTVVPTARPTTAKPTVRPTAGPSRVPTKAPIKKRNQD